MLARIRYPVEAEEHIFIAEPAGIGVQDFSMAGVFALLGYSFEQAVLASILWRGVFYLLPYIASLGFYWHLMRKMRRDLALAAQDVDHAHLDA